jgi:repressor LexA
MHDLTKRQREVLEFVTSCIDERGYSPTLREIGRSLGIRSTNGVHQHLRALEKKGYLAREGNKSRTLRPLSRMGRQLTLPLVGSVLGPGELLGPENVWESVTIDRLLTGGGKELFILRMGGDFTPCDGVLPGDYLVVRRSGQPERGDLMLVARGEQVEVQRRSAPARTGANPAGNGPARFLGVVVGLYRKVSGFEAYRPPEE